MNYIHILTINTLLKTVTAMPTNTEHLVTQLTESSPLGIGIVVVSAVVVFAYICTVLYSSDNTNVNDKEVKKPEIKVEHEASSIDLKNHNFQLLVINLNRLSNKIIKNYSELDKKLNMTQLLNLKNERQRLIDFHNKVNAVSCDIILDEVASKYYENTYLQYKKALQLIDSVFNSQDDVL